MTPEDWPSVAAIYGEGIATGDATFETEVPDWAAWDRARRRDCRIVAEFGRLEAPQPKAWATRGDSGVMPAAAPSSRGAGKEPGAAGPEKRPAPGSPRVLVGFACLSPVSERPAYAGVAEVMVYVTALCRRRGIGGSLLRALVREADGAGIWTLQAHVFPENEASVRLHERAGFRVAGVRERIGRASGGRWRDTVLLERRSDAVGSE